MVLFLENVPIAEGNIMVEEVLASCYAFTDHTLAHIGMAPIRGFPWMTE